MKLFKTYLLSVVASVTIFAGNIPDISSVMAKLEDGLINVQKGFLYNNIELIKVGINQVQKENLIYHDPKAILEMLPKDKKQMKNAAILTSYRIENASKELKEYLRLNQIRNAHGAFADIVVACTDCHVIVRGW